MSDNKIKEMAKLLTSGATMLAESCPKCGSPLFRLKDGKVMCPSCGFTPTETKPEVKPEAVTAGPSPSNKELSVVLKKKLSVLLDKLEKAEDPHEIKEAAEAIKLLLELIKQTGE